MDSLKLHLSDLEGFDNALMSIHSSFLTMHCKEDDFDEIVQLEISQKANNMFFSPLEQLGRCSHD